MRDPKTNYESKAGRSIVVRDPELPNCADVTRKRAAGTGDPASRAVLLERRDRTELLSVSPAPKTGAGLSS